jgi:hypothetical protein
MCKNTSDRCHSASFPFRKSSIFLFQNLPYYKLLSPTHRYNPAFVHEKSYFWVKSMNRRIDGSIIPVHYVLTTVLRTVVASLHYEPCNCSSIQGGMYTSQIASFTFGHGPETCGSTPTPKHSEKHTKTLATLIECYTLSMVSISKC